MASVAESFTDLLRTVRRSKARLLAAAGDDVESATHLLLHTVAVIAEHEHRRQAFFDEVLTGWSTEELRQFARQVERFTAAYEQTHIAWMSVKEGSSA